MTAEWHVRNQINLYRSTGQESEWDQNLSLKINQAEGHRLKKKYLLRILSVEHLAAMHNNIGKNCVHQFCAQAF